MTPEEMDLLVMRQIAETPEVNQRGVAQRLGISLGKVNFCLRALARKGLVKVDNFRRSDRKLAYAYVLTPAGIEEKTRLTMSFLQFKLHEYDELQREIAALKAEVNQLDPRVDQQPSSHTNGNP
ncbi:MarR family EPS-associated transcriptional regulator [soil metagenome]